MTIYGFTSLSPRPEAAKSQNAVLASWLKAGVAPVVFNHITELQPVVKLHQLPGITFVGLTESAYPTFGRHYVRVSDMARWGEASDIDPGDTVMFINADIEVRLAQKDLERIVRLTSSGLCFCSRYNHDGNIGGASRERYGIDVFLLRAGMLNLIPDSKVLCMGQPWWDYWLPMLAMRAELPLFGVEFPGFYHRNHKRAWSAEFWYTAGDEVRRIMGVTTTLPNDVYSLNVRHEIDAARRLVAQHSESVYDWLGKNIRGRKTTILELGAHNGGDTRRLMALPGAFVHAFEPDPRNEFPTTRTNFRWNRLAVGAVNGRAKFTQSATRAGKPWTYSGSLRAPTGHLEQYPDVTFGADIEVDVVTLDHYTELHGIKTVDFIWADVQGAERDYIAGGQKTLERTRYLYTEYSDRELYAGQPTLDELVALLPGRWRVVDIWNGADDNVLLENTMFKEPAP